MVSGLSAALAGLARSQRGVETASHNIANVHTDGYRTRRGGDAAPTAESRDLDARGSDADEPAALPSDVNLAAEFVELRRHETGYRANGAVIAAFDRMRGELLDVLA